MLQDSLTLLTKSSALSSEAFLGRALRYPLRLMPATFAMPIVTGKLRGKRWIVGSGIHRCWLGSYEQEKQRLISRAVQPGSVFYDIGANVGFYTLLGSLLVGKGKVFAFEPVPRNLSYLRQHLRLNRIENVEVLELALSDKDETSLFELEETGAMGRLSGKGNFTVQSAALDSLLQGGKILPPNYIKMDIEGAELLALRGAQECVRRYHPQFFLATHGHDTHKECCRLLESWGYGIRVFEFTSDGLGEIVAVPRT